MVNLLKPFFKDLQTFFLDTLFPIYCLSCGKEGNFLCTNCQKTITFLKHQTCIYCKKVSLGGQTHSSCLKPFSPEGLVSLLDYRDEVVSELIIQGKYYFVKSTFELLGQLMAQKLKKDYSNLILGKDYTNEFILCPIPLHSWRHRWRGFNQSEVLCKAISENLNLEVREFLERKKSTLTQKDLKKDQRQQNMENAFGLKTGVNIKGKNIFLVDDVTTTGFTLLEAVKALKRNGANQVWCLTAAKE